MMQMQVDDFYPSLHVAPNCKKFKLCFKNDPVFLFLDGLNFTKIMALVAFH